MICIISLTHLCLNSIRCRRTKADLRVTKLLVIICALRLTPFLLFFSTNQTSRDCRRLDKSLSHLLATVIAFPKVLLMCGIPCMTILFCQKLSTLSNTKLISCIFRIIAVTDCYIIFIICTSHYMLVYLSMLSSC